MILIFLNFFFNKYSIFFVFDNDIIGKIIPPPLFKYLFDELIIFKVKAVPSAPVLHGTFLNHDEFFANFSDIPETSLIIRSNFLFFHGENKEPFFNS